VTRAGTAPVTASSTTLPRGLMRWGVNPVVRLVLRSPAGRWTGPLLLLEVHGRRTGRRLRIPVVGHVSAGELHAITDGRWAANFRGGAQLTLVQRGHRRACTGLVLEETAAAEVIRDVVDREGAKALQLTVPPEVSDAELTALRRVIRLTDVPADQASPAIGGGGSGV
jgi:hypothetical protein